MFWIIGGDQLARAIGKWWGTPAGARFAEQFEHVEWEGFRFYDLIFLFSTARTQAILIAAILLGYWAVLMLVPAPETGKVADFAKETNLAGYLDRHYLPGKIHDGYYKYGDNEGLISTIPAVTTALLGLLAGQWLRTNRSPWSKAFGLIAGGVACLGVGMLWGQEFPVIKILWTSSYVLIAGGWSLILLGLFYAIIDVLKLRSWSYFFVVIGVNAITIYMMSRIIPFDPMARFFFGGAARLSGSFGPVILEVGTLALEWLLLVYLYRQRIFLRV
jgi:predicted acyltransferase